MCNYELVFSPPPVYGYFCSLLLFYENFYATLYDSQLRINYSNYVISMFEVKQA